MSGLSTVYRFRVSIFIYATLYCCNRLTQISFLSFSRSPGTNTKSYTLNS